MGAGPSNQASNDLENAYQSGEITMDSDSLSNHSYSPYIYKVPELLRRVSEQAYTPQVVSIGPLHHGKEGLMAMEEHKNRYFLYFLHRTEVSLEDYTKKIKDQEVRLRSCYAETIELSSDEFARIILVDAAFIIELLLRFCYQELQDDENDCIFKEPHHLLQDVRSDMQVLENQLPFFILEDLFDPDKTKFSSNNNSIERLTIISLSHNFFKTSTLMPIEGLEDNLERILSSRVAHFVDLLRNLYLPLESQTRGQLKTLTVPNVTELRQKARVKFKVGSSKNLFDIRFTKGILEIPKLILSSETEITVRNLIAFEQCHFIGKCMNDYFVLMNRFVNTQEDVELLVKYGIVENKLCGNSEGSTLINKLAGGAIVDPNDFYFATVCEDLNEHWRSFKATTQMFANLILVIAIIIQGVFSIINDV